MKFIEDLISVIVPVYKVEQYLPKCIDSILAQTYTNIEVILVDDGSPDKCGQIAEDYAAKDRRVRVVHKPNGGLSSARNAGVDIARGAYIGFVDSDDYIHPEMYARLYAAIRASSADMAVCNYAWLNEDGTLSETDLQTQKIAAGILDRSAAFAALFDRCNISYVTAFNKLYKYSLLNAVRFPEGKIHEDEFTVHHFFAQCSRIACISDILYYYVQRRGSITSGYGLSNLDVYDAMLDRYRFFKKNGYQAFAVGTLTRSMYSLLLNVKKVHGAKMLVRWAGFAGKFFRLMLVNPQVLIWISQKLPGRTVRYIKRYFAWVSVKSAFGRTAASGRRVILTATPEHGNTGDHAIVYAERQLFDRCGLAGNIVEIPDSVYRKYWERIRRLVRPQDLIVIDGGGNMGTLWTNEDDKIADIIFRFRENKILVFPQTCYYGEIQEPRLKRNREVYAAAPGLVLSFRDKESYDFAKNHFPDSRCAYQPDIVLAVRGAEGKKERDGVLLCFRKDREKVIDGKIIDGIKCFLENKKIPYAETDTVVDQKVSAKNRNVVLHSKWAEWGRAGLVVTDRLHGMVFAAITGTPCIAVDNVSRKVSGVSAWVKDLPYIRVLDSPADITKNILTMYRTSGFEYTFDYPHFFEEEIRRFLCQYQN